MKRDRREDPGQYFPGGKVIPKTPIPAGGGTPVEFDDEPTQGSQKAARSGGIWSWAKSLLPSWLTSSTPAPDKGAARPLPPYLHALTFDDTYPEDAEAFYATLGGNRVLGGCSIVRKGGLVGGNFDYPYDESASFAIRVSAAQGRHASVGMAYVGERLTENAVASGVYSPLYRVLPGMTESGINDAGVYAKINVIPRDESKDPAQSPTRTINALAVVRYVLDLFDNASDAATYIAAHYYIPEGSADSYHWVIADSGSTYIVEDGESHFTGTTANLPLTNFRAYGADTYGSGRKREEILAVSSTVESAVSAVRYTNAYAEGWPWPDEFAGQEDAEGRIPYTATARLKAWAEAHVAPLLDADRKPAARGNGCWQTVHSAIYDFAAKTMKVAVQETDEWFTFAVDAHTASLPWTAITGKPPTFPPSAHSHAIDDISNLGYRLNEIQAEAGRAASLAAEVKYDDLPTKLDKTDVIKQSQVTAQTPDGKAADAKDIKAQLAGKLDKSGGTMTGGIVVKEQPSAEEQIAVEDTDGCHKVGVTPVGLAFTEYGMLKHFKLPDGKSGDQTIAVLSDILARIAPAYSATSAYAIGAKVVYNGALYTCKTAIPTGGETWNAAHWDALSDLSGVLSGLKSDGTATDQFAADLMEKQVAKEAIRNLGLKFDETEGYWCLETEEA